MTRKMIEPPPPWVVHRSWLREAAYHEAGHTVIAFHLLKLRGGAWIRADGSGLTETSCGPMDWRSIGETLISAGVRRRLRVAREPVYDLDITLAGPAAQLIACDSMSPDDAFQLGYVLATIGRPGGRVAMPPKDHEAVAIITWGLHYGFTGQMPASLGGDYPCRFEDFIERRTAKVRAFLERPAIWAQVELVAARLMERKQVSFKWLDRALRRTSPQPGPTRAWRWERSAAGGATHS